MPPLYQGAAREGFCLRMERDLLWCGVQGGTRHLRLFQHLGITPVWRSGSWGGDMGSMMGARLSFPLQILLLRSLELPSHAGGWC